MILGITGGIASGKSTAAAHLKSLGAYIIDADEIARSLTAPGTQTTRQILQEFGPFFAVAGSPDTLDRSRLAFAVFRDSDLRRKLEQITHPKIIEEMFRQADEFSATDADALVGVEVPLLYEAELQERFDAVLVVWCSVAEQKRRLALRLPDITELEVDARIQSQIPIDLKRSYADYVISSELPLETMKNSLAELYGNLLAIGQ